MQARRTRRGGFGTIRPGSSPCLPPIPCHQSRVTNPVSPRLALPLAEPPFVWLRARARFWAGEAPFTQHGREAPTASHPTVLLAPEAGALWRLTWPPAAPGPQKLSGESGVCCFSFPESQAGSCPGTDTSSLEQEWGQPESRPRCPGRKPKFNEDICSSRNPRPSRLSVPTDGAASCLAPSLTSSTSFTEVPAPCRHSSWCRRTDSKAPHGAPT